jgi:hypothetical protein
MLSSSTDRINPEGKEILVNYLGNTKPVTYLKAKRTKLGLQVRTTCIIYTFS